MKKVLILSAVLAAFTACSNEDIVDIAGTNSQTSAMTFRATMEGDDDDADTRASIASNGKSIVWDEDDAISVISTSYYSDNNAKMTISSGVGTKNATFTGSCLEDNYYKAIYPYNENHTHVLGRGTKIYWNGVQQTAVAGSFPKNTPMIAQASVTEENPEVNLHFKNVCSFVKLTTNYPCRSITLKSKTRYLAAESFYVTEDSQGNPELPSGYDPSSIYTKTSASVTLTGEEGAVIPAGTYYIAVLPDTHENGLDLIITNAYDNRTWTKSTTKEVTFTRGHVLNLGTMDIKSQFTEISGTGSVEDPFLISTYEQLCQMRDWINSGQYYASYYKQTRDIDGEGAEFTPIGTVNDSEPHRFNGTYDGGGYTIKNIKPTTVYTEKIGNFEPNTKHCYVTALFAFVLDATIKNLQVENIDITGIAASSTIFINSYVKSPLVGFAFGSTNSITNIENVTVRGVQTEVRTVNYFTFGGIVGISKCHMNITNCTNYMSLENKADATTRRMGGIVGSAYKVQKAISGGSTCDANVNINKCRNYGYISDNHSGITYSGGIVGMVLDDTTGDDIRCIITNCVNFGNISETQSTSEFSCLGGIVGYMNSDGYSDKDPYVQNCINNGSIQLNSGYAGGITGACYDDDTQFINCANIGTVGGSTKGNIVGYQGTLSGCDTQSSLADYISVMNTNRPADYCEWKYAADSNNTKLDLDF